MDTGDFFFGTRGIFDTFQHATQAAMDLWKLDERTLREYTDRCFFTITEHRMMKSAPKISENNRCMPIRRWYWVPTVDAFFYPHEAEDKEED